MGIYSSNSFLWSFKNIRIFFGDNDNDDDNDIDNSDDDDGMC